MIDRWRLWAAAGLLVAMMVALVWAVVIRPDPGGTPPPISVPATVQASGPSGATTVDTTAPPLLAPSPIESAVAGFLDAWGLFAVTGDLSVFDGIVAFDGPRMDTFRQEAEAIALNPTGPPAYTITADLSDIVVEGDEAITRRTVTFTRPGEADQTYEWRFMLRRIDGLWQLWSITED